MKRRGFLKGLFGGTAAVAIAPAVAAPKYVEEVTLGSFEDSPPSFSFDHDNSTGIFHNRSGNKLELVVNGRKVYLPVY